MGKATLKGDLLGNSLMVASDGKSWQILAMEFTNVSASAKANIYFEGKVISHGITMADGAKKSFGVILPGSYHFGTAAAERMEIIDGACTVLIDGDAENKAYSAGEHFDVAANSGFTIAVESTPCQYICSYL